MILKDLVQAVGYNIPVQELFDVAIGTSTGLPLFKCTDTRLMLFTGGIIALGLFQMNWPVDETCRRFEGLAKEAFSLRHLLQTPVIRNVAQLFCTYKYRAEGIETALKTSFGTHRLFGQPTSVDEGQVKVGVVASIEGDNKPYLFANYNRNTNPGTNPYLSFVAMLWTMTNPNVTKLMTYQEMDFEENETPRTTSRRGKRKRPWSPSLARTLTNEM
jgi:hypothetical protein